MKVHLKKVLPYILTMAMILAILPLQHAAATVQGGPNIFLGSATFTSGRYYYSGAMVTGDNIQTILISFSDNVTSGDGIILPATPAGFTVSTSSAGNNYTKRINLNAGIAAGTVADYIRGIGFTVASPAQTVQVTITTESITQDTFYYADTGHYYQFVPDTTKTWTDAYIAAGNAAYMGRTGYLATVTSLAEDAFVNALSGKTGWLGGTILANTGTSEGSLYYNGFSTSSVVSSGWYWACGPEKGTTFYNINSLYPNQNDTIFINQQDGLNTAYYNWTRGLNNEPNNQTASRPNFDSSYETCLSTLKISGRPGKYGTVFSWNDLRYNSVGTDQWYANGYFVEYGNQFIGDIGSDSSSFAADSGTLERPYTVTVNTFVNGAPAAAPGSVELKQGSTTVCTLSSGATGVYTAPAVNGTYDIYIKNEDTGTDITIDGADNSAAVNYYRVNFAVSNINAPGSTVSATAGGASIASGTAVQSGKTVVITALGAGADTFTYLWSGAGTNGETSAAITIPSLGGAVNALCTVTGSTAPVTYAADIYTAADGVYVSAPGVVELKQGGVTVYTVTAGGTTGLYTVQAVDGTYDIYINNEDTGKNIIIGGTGAGVQVDYYTVSFSAQDAGIAWGSTVTATVGGIPLASGTAVLAGKAVRLTGHGAGGSMYVYAWSGPGINGEFGQTITITPSGTVNALCRVTGTAETRLTKIYTYADGVPATVPGSVQLWRGGAALFTAANTAAGVYSLWAAYGTFDVYINNEDTGIDFAFSSPADSTSVYYYTVNFAAANEGTASGSTISAAAGGTSIASGTAVLPGKAVTITAAGAGADAYTYLWSGSGTNGETDSSITIPAISGTVDALCTITGTTVQAAYAADICTAKDGVYAWAPGSVELKQSGVTVYTAAVSGTTGHYTAQAVDGTYDIYINNEDTGKNIIINGTAAGVQVDYYTMTFDVANMGKASGSTICATAGEASIASGTAVLAGKAVTVTAAGAGADAYTYLWSGSGTNGETGSSITIPAISGTVDALCTITGTTVQAAYAADICTAKDGVYAWAPGSVELKQSGVTVYTAAVSGTTGHYTAQAVDGTYDIYINNEDTGKNIIINGTAAGVQVDYYTITFDVANMGKASGSTICATAGGASIASGTAVLAGKAVTVTAAGKGADTYTYLWSGSGTNGETDSSITIPAISGTVNALCTVTGAANTFAPGTLEEKSEDTTIIAEGLFTQDARLYIIPIPEGEAAREELESMLSSKQTAAAFEVHIEPADAFKAPLTLSFQVGQQYNGRSVYILHKLHSGSVEQFTVTVANGEAVITVTELSPFLLTVDPPVALTAVPQSVTVVTGQTATFTVTATGTEPLTYRWQKRTGTNASWEDIPGAVNSSHTTSQANMSNSGFQYRVIVTDAYERSVTSEAATLTVTKAPEPPATGDRSQPALYMVLIILFMLSSVLLLRKRKTV